MNNDRILRKSRRLKRLLGIILLILAVIAASIAVLNSSSNSKGVTYLIQCIIPLSCIALAAVFVSLPGKIVRSKLLLIAIFAIILCFGIYVNAGITQSGCCNPFRTILLPFNMTLAAFFPSRGDYDLTKVSCEWLAPYLIFHACTYFYTAWLGFSLFGRKILNRTALAFIPNKQRNLIWGYSDGAVELAKDMINDTDRDEPIFILDDDIEFESEKEKRIFDHLSNEGILAINTHYDNLSESAEDFHSGPSSLHYWKSIFTQGKNFEGFRHYFITENQDFNVKYALIVLNQLYLQKDRLKCKTHIFVRSELEGIDTFFQEKLNDGLADKVEVHIFNQSDITARQFVEDYPVLNLADRTNPATGEKWLSISHDTLQVDGEINILLLGLGWTGFEMLKKQVCDAQFIGNCKVNAVVIDNDYKQMHGRYQYIVKEAAKFGINICINPSVWIDNSHRICKQWLSGEKCRKEPNLEEQQVHQANSHLFYEWLGFKDTETRAENIIRFNRIIIALGSDELNVNTALQLTHFRNRYLSVKENMDETLMPEPIFAHVRDKERYYYYENHVHAPIRIFGGLKSIYTAENLVDERMDRIAKLVNYVYSQHQKTTLSEDELITSLSDSSAETIWAKCDIFDKDSSRAVAMNLCNMVKLSNGLKNLEDMVNDPVYIEKLSELEHKRWNAFHFMHGIGTWDMAEVQTSKDNKGTVKAKGKLYFNGKLVRHICLVDYTKLDDATRRVRILGNTDEDFKASDQRIIRHFPTFYKLKELK